ncbi:MAG: S8 family serine peptidase, partial [Bacteroidales bacterium]|nr:S8 family serine peptidase [Bacteroidales bacterium]
MSGTNSRVLQGWTCGGGNGRPLENCSHGQCVTGIIAASHNNIGVAGIAPNTKIVPIRIQKDYQFVHWSWEGTYYSYYFSHGKIARAIKKSWKKYGAEILNNSWGGRIVHNKILRAFEKAADKGRAGKGCVITASAGNEGYTDKVNELGLLPSSICVGAINKYGQRVQYSNYMSDHQSGIDVVAFGGRYDSTSLSAKGFDIRTIDREGNKGMTNSNYYDYFGGTSAAAPMVSGVASLMLSVNPDLTANQVKTIIERTAQKLNGYQFEPVSSTHPNGTWNEQVGYGLVDAHKAVVHAYMFGQDSISITASGQGSCGAVHLTCEISHPELFTFEWHCSSNMVVTDHNGIQATVMPLSSGSGTVTVNVMSYGRVMYTKSITVDLTSALETALQPVSTTPITITNDTQWPDSNMLLPANLTIDSLATLTISGSLYITPTARLIIRPGGKLIVDGGTLTSACAGEMWQGIEVVGNPGKRQEAKHQGYVDLKNGAVIENAHCAVLTGIQGDNGANSGGIVKAINTTFRNNARSVDILPYAYILPGGGVRGNIANFSYCNFTIDEDNHFSQNSTDFTEHVRLNDVSSVEFYSCSFSSGLPYNIAKTYRAIYAEDAGFIISKGCPDGLVFEDCVCPESFTPCNTFTGFNRAIEANTTGNQYEIRIDQSKFGRNGTGIRINGNNFVTVTRDSFDLTQGYGSRLGNRTGLFL